MGEAARRKRLGLDGRKMGDAVRAALNQDVGGDVWAWAKQKAIPNEFIVLSAESPDVRTGAITNREAAATRHRVVGQVLIRRGEPWLEAMIFDPCEEFRQDLYVELGMNAIRIAHGLMEGERVDEVWHETVTTTWPNELEMRRTMKITTPPGERTA
jgi:hypothetical protein